MVTILDFNTLSVKKPQILTPKRYGDELCHFHLKDPASLFWQSDDNNGVWDRAHLFSVPWEC